MKLLCYADLRSDEQIKKFTDADATINHCVTDKILLTFYLNDT